MSSGMKSGGRGGHTAAMIAGDKMGLGPTYQSLNNIGRMGMSPRQQELNRLWAYYTCEQYAPRKMAWDGSPHVEGLEHDSIATATTIPPGFYMGHGQDLPLRFRRPTAPYHICKVIVDRFTGLLFSQKRHPRIQLEADPTSEDFAQALVDEARLWAAMIQARTFGGATGSAAVGFQFVDGVPHVEVHDPRFAIPEFYDRTSLRLRRFEKRYIYHREAYSYEEEEWTEIPYWYRRVIDDKQDVIFAPVPVEDGVEPNWEANVEVAIPHNFGFCPVVWIQNIPRTGEIDGEPDCHGVYEASEEYDALMSQASRGTKANCDPTPVIASDDDLDESIRKGSGNLIKLSAGGNASYMEIAGSGPQAARDQAVEVRKNILEVSQCVLEHPDTGQKTATEVERVYSSMLSKADVMREQYGERGVKPLVNMMMTAAKMVTEARDIGGRIERGSIELPPKITKLPGGDIKREDRKLGKGPYRVSLQWPGYFEPSLNDANLAVQAAAGAKAGGLIDDEHAVKAVAPYFDVEDVGQMTENLKKEKEEEQRQMFAGIPGFGGEG